MKNQPAFIKRLYEKITSVETTRTKKEIDALQTKIKELTAGVSERIADSMAEQLAKLVKMDVLTPEEAQLIAKDYALPTTATSRHGITKSPKSAKPEPVGDPCARGYSGGCR